MSGPKQFSPDWWKQKNISHPWCDRFCHEFFAEDPSLINDPKTYQSVGVIFINKSNGDIIPVGITAVQDGNFIFQYHHSYLDNPKLKAIADSLPKRKERYVCKGDMLPYFDNLPAEGWFGKAQSEALGNEDSRRLNNRQDKHMDMESLEDRYHRFMMFGRDYPGAVWATYIHNDPVIATQNHEHMIEAALLSRSSIAGVQPKLLGVEDPNGNVRPATYWETSTHIVKLRPIEHLPRLLEYEYMSIMAMKQLLPNDSSVNARLTDLQLPNGETTEILAIKRFDRTNEPHGKIHFEEINQLLSKYNVDRYNGSYSDIAKVIESKIGHEAVQQFYARLMSQFLLGNTDNHLKNFALFTGFEEGAWRMTPDYDLAPTVNYNQSPIALYTSAHRYYNAGGMEDDNRQYYAALDTKALVQLGESFGLSLTEIQTTIKGILANIPAAKEAIMNDPSPRLDQPAPETQEAIKQKSKQGKYKPRKETCREDFCDRIDGRAQKLFGTLDKYIEYRASRAPSAAIAR